MVFILTQSHLSKPAAARAMQSATAITFGQEGRGKEVETTLVSLLWQLNRGSEPLHKHGTHRWVLTPVFLRKK